MKFFRFIICAFFAGVISLSTNAQTISTNDVGGPYCDGATFDAPFTVTGSFTSSTFTANLSDASGSFASPTVIGSGIFTIADASDVLSVTIPLSTASGTGYRIRIESVEAIGVTESPVFEIETTPTIDPISSVTACDSYTLPVIAGTNLNAASYWTESGGTGTQYLENSAFTVVGTTTLYAYDATAGGCSAEQSFDVTIETTPTIDPISAVTACDSYTLPVIAGTNLNAASYWTESGGTGTQYLENSSFTVVGTTTLYAYDATAGGCSAEQSFDVTIETTPTIDPISAVTACDSYTLPVIAGTNLNAASYWTESGGTGTQYLENSSFTVVGTTTLYAYDATAGGCSAEQSFDVTIETTPTIDPISAVTACDSYTLPVIAGTNLNAASYWTESGGTGTQYLENSAFTVVGTTTLYAYDATAGGCSAEQSFDVTIETTPTIDPISAVTACDSYTLPVIAGTNLNAASYWTESGGTGTQYLENSAFTVVGTTTLYAYDATAGGCSAEESFSITIETTPTIDPISAVTACDSYTLPVIAGTNLNAASYWTESGGTGTQYLENSVFTVVGTTTLYAYDATVGGCSAEQSFDITIETTPSIDPINAVTACDSYTLPVIAGTNLNVASYWTESGGTGTQYLENSAFTVVGTTTLYAYDATAGGCSAEQSFDVTIETTPTIDPISAVTACDSYTLPVISGTNLNSASYWTESGGSGTQYLENSAFTVVGTTTLYAYDATAGGCSAEQSFDVTIETTPSIDPISTVTACDSYTLPVIAGTNLNAASYWTESGGTGTQYLENSAFTVVGTTTLYAYDATAGGCSAEQSFDVTIETTPSIDPISAVTACDSYTLPVIAGTNLNAASYWTESGGTGTQYLENSAFSVVGTTTLYAYDINGLCSAEQSFSITINNPLSVSLDPIDACYGEDIIFQANASGGTGTGYTYEWRVDGNLQGETGSQLNLSSVSVSSTIDVSVMDDFIPTAGGNCTATASTSLTVNNQLNVTVEDKTICNGESVTLTASPSGGNGNYTYLWSTGEDTQSISVDPNTTEIYSVTISDDFVSSSLTTCSSLAASATVTVNPGISVIVEDKTICQGESITLTATPGGGTGNYSFLWNTGETTATISVNPSSTSVYTVQVSDDFVSSNGTTCTSMNESATVTVNPALTVTADDKTICEGESVVLTANPAGGNGNYAFSWSTGETTQSITVSPTSTTIYSVTITDDFISSTTSTCTSLPFDVQVSVNPALDVTVAEQFICNGESATLTATPAGGTGNYSFLWNTGATTQSIEVSPGSSTTYSVTVTDDFISSVSVGCSSPTFEVDVTVYDLPVADFTVDDVCNGETANFSNNSSLGANSLGTLSYFWDFGDGVGTSTDANPTYTYAIDGSYNVVLTVTQNDGGVLCTSQTDYVVEIFPLPIEITSSLSTNDICDLETVIVTVNSPQAGIEYKLQDGNGVDISNQVSGPEITSFALPETLVNPIRILGINTTTNCDYVFDDEYTINFKSESTPVTAIIRSDNNVCPGTGVTLEATGGINGDGADIVWYTQPNGGGTSIHVGPGPFVVNPNSTTTYYARREGDCNVTIDNTSVVTVLASPTEITQVIESRPTECPGEGVTLTASGGLEGDGSVVRWYLTPTPANSSEAIFTGAGPFLVNPATTTDYYVRRENSCIETGMFAYELSVNTLSTIESVTASETDVCPGSLVTLTANNYQLGTGASLNWFTGPNGSGTNLGPGSNGTLTINPSSTTTYYAFIDGPCNSVEESVTISIKATSAISDITKSTDNVCPGTEITFTANGVVFGEGASVVNWYTGSNGSGTFLGSGNPFIYNASSSTAIYGRIAGECNTIEASTSISVIDPPDLVISNPGVVCGPGTVDITNPSLVVDNNTTSGTFSYWTNIEATIPLINASAIDISGTYYIKKTTTVGGCSDVKPIVVTINQPAEVEAGPDLNICEVATVQMNGSFSGSTSSITWTTDGDGSFDDPTKPDAVYTLLGNDLTDDEIVLTITTNDPDNGGPCVSVQDVTRILIGGSATAFAGNNFTICEDETTQLNGVVSGGVTTGQWTTSGDGSFDNNQLLNAVYTPGSNDISTGSVTLTLTSDDPPGACTAAMSDVIITIDPVGSIEVGSNLEICENESALLNAVLSGKATSVSWTSAGDGTFNNSTIVNPEYTPGSNDISAGSVLITATITDANLAGSSCVDFSDQLLITVNSLPNITITPVADICADGSPVVLSATPSGGTFSGAGVTGDNFDPVSAGPGLQNISYTYSDGNGCTNSETIQINVLPLPADKTLTEISGLEICEGETITIQVDNSDTGFSYIIHDNSGNPLSSEITGGGNISLTSLALDNSTEVPLRILSKNITTQCDSYLSTDLNVTFKTISEPVSNFIKSDDNICPGTSVTLTAQGGASGSGAQVVWYSSPGGVDQIGTGSSIDVSPGVTTTYYARREGDCNTTIDNSVTIVVFTESTELTVLDKTGDNICPGTSIQLTASGGIDGTNSLIKWYDGPNGTGTNIHIGSGPFPVQPSITTTYYVRREGSCNITADSQITVNVKTESSAPTTVESNIDDICPGENVLISASGGISGTGSELRWYDNASGTGSPIFTGAGPHTVNPLFTSEYFVRREGDCNNSDLASVTVAVKSESFIGIVSPNQNNVCPGTLITLEAESVTLGNGATFGWYTEQNGGGTLLGTSNPIDIMFSTNQTVYAYINGDCGIVEESVDILVKTESGLDGVTSNVNDICPGSTVTLSPTNLTLGTNATFAWYSSPGGSGLLSTSTSFDVQPAVNTTYFGLVQGDCNSIEFSVSINVKEESTLGDLSKTSDLKCPGESVTLTADDINLGTSANFGWYSSPGGVGLIGSSSNLEVTPTVTTTYYARIDGECNDIEKSIQVEVVIPPDLTISSTPAAECSPNTVDITGSWIDNNSSMGNVTYWKDAAATSEPLINPESIAESGIYYIRKTTTVGGCFDIASVVVTVNQAPEVDAGQNLSVCSGFNDIQLNGTIGGSTTTVNWTTSGDGSFNNSNLVDPTYTLGASDISNGNVTLTISSTDTDGSGPCIIATDFMTISIGNSVGVSAGDDFDVCEDDIINLDGSFSGGASSASWSIVTGTGTFNNANDPQTSYTPSAGDISNGFVEFQLTTNDPPGPCTSSSDNIRITINPKAIVSAGNSQVVCSDAIVVLSGQVSGGTTQGFWSTSGNGSFDNFQNLNTTYTLGSDDISNGGVTLTLTSVDPDGSGPCVQITDQLSVNINPTPDLIVIDPDPFCDSDFVDLNTVYSDGNSLAGTVSFWRDAGRTQPLTNPESVSNAGTYFIYKETSNGCFDQEAVVVQTFDTPDVIISSIPEVCEPETVDLSDKYEDTRSLPGTFEFFFGGSPIDESELNLIATSGVFIVTKTTPQGCVDTQEATVNINVLPSLIVETPDPVCEPVSVDLTTYVTDANNTSGNIEFSSTADFSTIVQNPELVTVPGLYYVRKSSSSGCVDEATINIVIQTPPDLVATDPDPVCAPATIDLTATVVDNANTDGTFRYFSDAGLSNEVDNPTEISSEGIYYIRKTTTIAGCSDVVSVEVKIDIAPELTVGQPLPICANETIDITQFFLDTKQTTGSVSVFADEALTLQVDDPTRINKSGTYYIKKETLFGKCSDVVSINIEVNPIPEPPSITFDQSSQELVSSVLVGNQWYDSNGPIEGATAQRFKPETGGSYYATLTEEGCTSEPSDFFELTITGLSDEFGEIIVNVFPNPVTDRLYLDFSTVVNPDRIQIRDINGREVVNLEDPDPAQRWSFEVDEWGTGTYILIIQKGDEAEVRKVVVN